MQEIAKTEFYTIAVDLPKNRLYQTIKGSWVRPVKGDPYLQDFEKAAKLLKKGFTGLSDATQISVMSQEWTEAAQKTRQILIEAGISKAAEVLSESVILKMQVQRIFRQAGFTMKFFSNLQEAEAWLDGKE
ncbi:hypothetical protein U27_00875 [Candidatus Vecturithrix granuli]|uniref:STAS/SEC14 domain-containing protein n=1 Tax=Vecturithrix granuli TaxID=1499967 RepID=A0A081C8S2_VECG1|nr:hypothetical protein U27_00875 [Candidatus Vecturithrix granuli]